jgi:transposase
VVGGDDCAGTKGRRYGTLLGDREAQCLVALFPTCEVETVAAWFRQHPSVLIVTRDRSLTIALAIRRGAPQALPMAARFHLPMTALTGLETLLTREQATIRRVVARLRTDQRAAHPAPPKASGP